MVQYGDELHCSAIWPRKAKMTITEALAEIKTINARVLKKIENLNNYILRDSRVVDPLHASGGSGAYVKAEMQSIRDLGERIIRLRALIQLANHGNKLTLSGETRSVADWLTWRREISAGQKAHIDNIIRNIQSNRKTFQKSQHDNLSNRPPGVGDGELVVNVDEKWVLGESDRLEKLLGDLDGQLSLFNAKTEVALEPLTV